MFVSICLVVFVSACVLAAHMRRRRRSKQRQRELLSSAVRSMTDENLSRECQTDGRQAAGYRDPVESQ
jgi:hypothetical protein